MPVLLGDLVQEILERSSKRLLLPPGGLAVAVVFELPDRDFRLEAFEGLAAGFVGGGAMAGGGGDRDAGLSDRDLAQAVDDRDPQSLGRLLEVGGDALQGLAGHRPGSGVCQLEHCAGGLVSSARAVADSAWEERRAPARACMLVAGRRAADPGWRRGGFPAVADWLVFVLGNPGLGADALGPAVELGLGLLLLVAVALLQGSHQLVAVAGGALEVVVGQLAPEALSLSLELFPLPLEDVVCHGVGLLSADGRERGRQRHWPLTARRTPA